MVHAIVLLEAERHRINDLAQELLALPGVTEVYSITGDYDLIAVVRVKSPEEVADVVTGRLQKVSGILDSNTHVAFRVYSKHDLEAAFSLGT